MEQVTEQRDWSMRPWVLAGVGALGGLLFYLLVDSLEFGAVPIDTATLARMAAATFVGVATLSFIVTAERVRLGWAVAYALGWATVMALVGYFTASYDRTGEIMGFPFASGILAVGIAAPLFQTMRDEGRRSLPYDKVHRYAWTDAIIGGASLAFTGLTFALAFLLSELFYAIGISLLRDLLREGWFGWMIAGAAFGGASGVLRERDALLGTLQKLVMVVFSVLAPVLAVSLALYLVALPATGFGGLWRSGLPETPLLLSAAAFAFVFLNAIIGDSSDDRGKGVMWRATEAVLLFAVLPLGVLALVSMGMRVGQYGWTPERLWGVLACLVAIAYGISQWIAVVRKRWDFDGPLRESQKHLAIGLCALALFLALPIVDFGAISTRSQLARLESGKVAVQEFDWRALAMDFGPRGRAALERIGRSGSPAEQSLAKAALAAKSRYDIMPELDEAKGQLAIETTLKVLPESTTIEPALKDLVAKEPTCAERNCTLIMDGPDKAVLVGHPYSEKRVVVSHFVRQKEGGWSDVPARVTYDPDNEADPHQAPVEIRTVQRRQVFVDGKPAGEPFE